MSNCTTNTCTTNTDTTNTGTTNACGASACTTRCATATKKPSQLGFLLAMGLVVALGGGAYMYLDTTVFGPVDAQEQTVLNNPGVGHPPKGKRPTTHTATTTTTTTTTTTATAATNTTTGPTSSVTTSENQ